MTLPHPPSHFNVMEMLMWSLVFLVSIIMRSSYGQMFPGSGSLVPEVITSQGKIRGSLYTPEFGSVTGKSIAQFIGIPFAASPVRGNRFREPQPVERWFGDYDAIDKRVSCLQTDSRFSTYSLNNKYIPEDEDCLYLNVFMPQSRSGVTQRYPVLVYFHGGEFKYGGKDYFKPDLLLQHDVVLVVPNYRLGVLGFLATDDEFSPGNYGIRDQIAALRWVVSEIHAFLGDPNAITIMGHDAGAISTQIHLFSPESRGLFNRTITSSGSIFTPWAFQEDPYYQARTFGQFFNCYQDSRRLTRCLREKAGRELISAASVNGYWFRPVIDKNLTRPLLRDYPRKLYERGDFVRVPLLAGLVRNEGTLDYYSRYHQVKRLANSGSTLLSIEELIKPYVRRYTNTKVLAAAIDYNYIQKYNHSAGNSINNLGFRQNTYPNNGVNNQMNFQAPFAFNFDDTLANILGDYLYNAPTDLTLKMHSRSGAPTYLYVLTYRGSKSFGPLQKTSPREVTRDSYGVTHFDDIFYIFPTEYQPQDLDATGKMVSAALTRCIFSFINPLLGGSGCNFRAPYTDADPSYLNFGASAQPLPSTRNRDPQDMMFWNEMIHSFVEFTATPFPYFPYNQYEGFKAATWSLTALIILFIIIIIILISLMFVKRNEEKRSMKLLRARDRELEERYRNEPDSVVEKL